MATATMLGLAFAPAFSVLAADAPVAKRETPSGQPVPRYVSTKSGDVNARAGPGADYRLLWTYRVRNLPLQVIAETQDWRRVCDPDGGVAWIKQSTVREARTVLRTSPRDLLLRRRPSETSGGSAALAGRSIAVLKTCAKGWCRLSADKAEGWVRQGEVWGTADAPQCR